jgi:hypothetical protein
VICAIVVKLVIALGFATWLRAAVANVLYLPRRRRGDHPVVAPALAILIFVALT